MSIIGQIDSLWRYPVKSVRGEEMDELLSAMPEYLAIDSLLSLAPPLPPASPISPDATNAR